jgi:hypothetical protein
MSTKPIDSKFAVTYLISYVHRVVVGVTASNSEDAINVAKSAFDDGSIWDNTSRMPLLFDDFEEVEGDTLTFMAEAISMFPEPDASVIALKQKELAFYACQSLLMGETETALNFAKQAVPFVAEALAPDSIGSALKVKESVEELMTSSTVLILAKEHGLKLSFVFSPGLETSQSLALNLSNEGFYSHQIATGDTTDISSETFLRIYPDSLGKVWRVDRKDSLVQKTGRISSTVNNAVTFCASIASIPSMLHFF